MKQIIKRSATATIERDGDKIIKTFAVPKKRWLKEWWHNYDAYYHMFGGVPRVHEVNTNRIVMDYVEGDTMEDLFWKHDKLEHGIAYKLFAVLLQNLSNMAEYSSMIDSVWFHNDSGAHNYIYDGEKFTLVDPDSFILTKNPYPGSFVSHLYPLQNVLAILHSMHERDYDEHVK